MGTKKECGLVAGRARDTTEDQKNKPSGTKRGPGKPAKKPLTLTQGKKKKRQEQGNPNKRPTIGGSS